MEQTLQNWYETTHTAHIANGSTAKAHLLKQAYHKTLSYEVYQASMGYDFPQAGLITLCNSLYTKFCWQAHIL